MCVCVVLACIYIYIYITSWCLVQLHRNWGERYHEWIRKAEEKMKELQEVNTML